MGLETEGGTVISEWDGLGTDMGRFKQSYRKQTSVHAGKIMTCRINH